MPPKKTNVLEFKLTFFVEFKENKKHQSRKKKRKVKKTTINQCGFLLFKVHVLFFHIFFYGSALLQGRCLGRLIQEVFQNKSMAGFQSKTLQTSTKKRFFPQYRNTPRLKLYPPLFNVSSLVFDWMRLIT